MAKAKPGKNYSLLPCGVNEDGIQQIEKQEARKKMGLSQEKKFVLFASAFNNAVKNASLAKESVSFLHDENVELLELKGYSHEEVIMLMRAVDVLLRTSNTEGSPQVVKEALVCGCPIVSVDVGDVKERMDGVDGCFVAASREPLELSKLLKKAMDFEGKTKGRDKLFADGLDNPTVARRLIERYERIING